MLTAQKFPAFVGNIDVSAECEPGVQCLENCTIGFKVKIRELGIFGNKFEAGAHSTFGPNVVAGTKVTVGPFSCVDGNVVLPADTVVEEYSRASQGHRGTVIIEKASSTERYGWDEDTKQCVLRPR